MILILMTNLTSTWLASHFIFKALDSLEIKPFTLRFNLANNYHILEDFAMEIR